MNMRVTTKKFIFTICDECKLWDRGMDIHSPECSIGKRVRSEKAARAAAAAAEIRAQAATRRATTRASRSTTQ
jgi:hypothetical protein